MTTKVEKSRINHHSRNYFQTKRLMSFITHFSLLMTFYVSIKSWYKSIHVSDIDSNFPYLFFNFIAPLGSIVLIITNIFYITLYYFEFPFFEKMKSNNLPWPWKENPEKFWRELPDMIITYLRNDFVFFPISLCLTLKVFSLDYEINNLPSFTRFWITIWGSFLLEDFFHYWTHRFIHHPKLYWIHKKHHSQYNPIHINCVYSHWIEFVFGVMFPLFAGAMVLQENMHIATFMGIILFRGVETHESHGGYELSFSVFQITPFMVDSNYHNFHHLKNIGNYGTYWIWWDSLFGTNDYYMERFEEQKISAH